MHEVQIQKLRWLLRELGIDAEFSREVMVWDAKKETEFLEDVDGIFISHGDADKLIDFLRIASAVAA